MNNEIANLFTRNVFHDDVNTAYVSLAKVVFNHFFGWFCFGGFSCLINVQSDTTFFDSFGWSRFSRSVAFGCTSWLTLGVKFYWDTSVKSLLSVVTVGPNRTQTGFVVLFACCMKEMSEQQRKYKTDWIRTEFEPMREFCRVHQFNHSLYCCVSHRTTESMDIFKIWTMN